MSSKLLRFKGLMAPTFTPFDKKFQINYSVIESYAKLLKSKGISAILVNGTSGEGMSLSVDERKKVTEKWSEVCKKFDILLMTQIAGCPFVDVIELAKHSADLKVDGVLCLPELYFKPKSVENLVDYVSDIATYCPEVPLYYYHHPTMTQVDLPVASFMEQAKKKIPSFAGIKYSSGDFEKAVPCLKHGQVFIGCNTILIGALALGFTNAIMTPLNIRPEASSKIIELMKKGKVIEALEEQNSLNLFIEAAMNKRKGAWVLSMKEAFNEEFKDLQLGTTRKPL